MTRLAATIASLKVDCGSLAIIWLGQAGFVFKTSNKQLIFIDTYLSITDHMTPDDVGSKRLIPAPLEPTEIVSGLMVSTHAHEDHCDEESIAIIARNAPHVHFGGPVSCMRTLKKLKIPDKRMHLLAVREIFPFQGASVRAVYADHGNSEPQAVGIVLETDGIRVYHTGDTSYCPERMEEVISLKPDIIITCINGTYGNLNGIEAARLARDVGARVAIPCHFWFFINQNLKAERQPAAFLGACEEFTPQTTPVILMVSEPYIFTKK